METKNEIYIGWDEYYKESIDKPAWDSKPSHLVELLIRQFSFHEHPKIHIADFGCGDGRNLWPILEHNITLTAIDLSTTALNSISKRCYKESLKCPTLVSANLEALPLASDQFDGAQCIDALPQVWNIREAIIQITNTLRTNGKFLFNVFTPKDCAYGEGEKIDTNTFVYKQTLFRFFEEEDVLGLLPKNLEVINCVRESWEDPPHIPFRPYPHTHDGIYFLCRKV